MCFIYTDYISFLHIYGSNTLKRTVIIWMKIKFVQYLVQVLLCGQLSSALYRFPGVLD